MPWRSPSGSVAGSTGARPTARPAAGNSTAMRCGSAVDRRPRAVVGPVVRHRSLHACVGWPACSARRRPGRRASGGAVRRPTMPAVADLRSVASAAARSMPPSPSSRCSCTPRRMSSTCTFTSRSARRRGARPRRRRARRRRQCPRSTVMPSPPGAPSSSRSRRASATVSTSMPGSGSNPSATPDAAGVGDDLAHARTSRRQPSSASTPSGSTPDQSETHSARRSAARSTARRRNPIRRPRTRRRAWGGAWRRGRAGTACPSRRRRASRVRRAVPAVRRPGGRRPRRTGRGADARG